MSMLKINPSLNAESTEQQSTINPLVNPKDANTAGIPEFLLQQNEPTKDLKPGNNEVEFRATEKVAGLIVGQDNNALNNNTKMGLTVFIRDDNMRGFLPKEVGPGKQIGGWGADNSNVRAIVLPPGANVLYENESGQSASYKNTNTGMPGIILPNDQGIRYEISNLPGAKNVYVIKGGPIEVVNLYREFNIGE